MTLTQFRAMAKKMKPTKAHRAAIWENMLGTVYAMDPAGNVQYFDYDHAAALAFVGMFRYDDVRCCRFKAHAMHAGHNGNGDFMSPRDGQLVWFVQDEV